MYQNNLLFEFNFAFWRSKKTEEPIITGQPSEVYKKLVLKRDYLEAKEIEECLKKCPNTKHLVKNFKDELAIVRYNQKMRIQVYMKYQRILRKEGSVYPTNLYKKTHNISVKSPLVSGGGDIMHEYSFLNEAHLIPYLTGTNATASFLNNFEDQELRRLAIEDPKLYKEIKKKRAKRYHNMATSGGVVMSLIHKPLKAAVVKTVKSSKIDKII